MILRDVFLAISLEKLHDFSRLRKPEYFLLQ